MDFDRILVKCGDFNRYQFLLLSLYALINFSCAIHYFSQTIISFVPNHWCYHEKLENKTFTEIAEIYSSFHNPSCTRLEEISENNFIKSQIPCKKWIYDYDYGFKSMNTEFNWVCDSAYKARIGQSVFFIGSVLGTTLFGLLADRIGRIPTLLLANLSGFIGDFSTIFTNDMITFSICRLISGLAVDMNLYLMYIIVLEYIRPSMRTTFLNLGIGLFYCLGQVVTPWIAVLVGHWKYYLIFTSVPLLSSVVFYPIICESAQWLVTADKIDESIKQLTRIAKVNKKTVTEDDFNDFKKFCEIRKAKEATESKANLIDMFKTPRLRNRTLIIFFKSMVVVLCFDGVSRNVEGLGVSPFIMFSLTASALLPGCIVVVLFQDKIGRKLTASSSLLIGGIFSTIAGIILASQANDHNRIVVITMQILSRFGVAMAYQSSAQYAAELMPTCVRGQGFAATHVVGYAVSFLSSYILLLGSYYKPTPSIIFGVLFFLGAFACLFLPETLNKTLPKTLSEGEEFGRGERFYDFVPCAKKEKEDTRL